MVWIKTFGNSDDLNNWLHDSFSDVPHSFSGPNHPRSDTGSFDNVIIYTAKVATDHML